MSTPLYVERASLDDLPGVWAIGSPDKAHTTNRQHLMNAVEQRRCLVAKSGWNVAGFAVRTDWFFDYTLIAWMGISSQYPYVDVMRALLRYAETTNPQDRLFIALRAGHQPIAQVVLKSMGYESSGSVQHLQDEQPRHIYCKFR